MRLLTPLFEARVMTMEAHPQRLGEARDWAREVAAEAGLAEPDCFQVRLAMSEAVGNAIQHGSREESDPIRIDAYKRNGHLVFEVRDTGRFTAPATQSTLDDEGGRGLEVLAMIMDEVEMQSVSDGSIVRFAKRIG